MARFVYLLLEYKNCHPYSERFESIKRTRGRGGENPDLLLRRNRHLRAWFPQELFRIGPYLAKIGSARYAANNQNNDGIQR